MRSPQTINLASVSILVAVGSHIMSSIAPGNDSTVTSASPTVFVRYESGGFVYRGLPMPKPTVSLDARPIVIPILSCVFSFPVVAFAVICALRYRAQRLRRRDHLKRIQSGCRSVTLEIPAREKSSYFSKDSSSDPSLRGTGERSEIPDSPSVSSRRSSKNNNHVKFLTTTAVLHAKDIASLSGRFGSDVKTELCYFENVSHVECAETLAKELKESLEGLTR